MKVISVVLLVLVWCGSICAQGLHQDEHGVWVNDKGGNVYGDSWVTDRARPEMNLNADPVFNMKADPVYNMNADPVFSITADPTYYDGGADYAYGPDDYVQW